MDPSPGEEVSLARPTCIARELSFSDMDQNGDGVIDKAEFLQAQSNGSKRSIRSTRSTSPPAERRSHSRERTPSPAAGRVRVGDGLSTVRVQLQRASEHMEGELLSSKVDTPERNALRESAVHEKEESGSAVRMNRRLYALATSEWQSVLNELGRSRKEAREATGALPGSPDARRGEIKVERLEGMVKTLAQRVEIAGAELQAAEEGARLAGRNAARM